MPQRAGSGDGSEAETLPLGLLDADDLDLEEDLSSGRGSIDHLLAATDDGWEPDDQVRTLQQEVAKTRAADASAVSARSPAPAAARASKAPPPLPRRAPVPALASLARSPEAPRARALTEMLQPDGLLDVLQHRATLLEAQGDKIGLARVYVELAVASEILVGDDRRAATWAGAALHLDPSSPAAHALLRRIRHGRASLAAMLEHLDHEVLATTHDADRVELLSEKARVLDAVGARSDDVRAAWEQVLAFTPDHAAALKGLEAELVARTLASGSAQDWDALAAHLGRMADAYPTDPALAAWLHVERARILERKLDRIEAARGALERALELDPQAAPVRDALVRHAAAQGDWGALVRLLDADAQLDPNPVRAARLEVDAALIALWRLGDAQRARTLLERAAARAPTAPNVDRRALDELVRLAEADGRWADAGRARRARLRFVTEPAVLAYELRTLAAMAERDGDLETAINDVQRALALGASDPPLLDWLDRLLAGAGKNDQRVASWLQESARATDPTRRAAFLVHAATVCEGLGRRADAVRHLRSAWVALPGDIEVLDALQRVLAPVPPEATDSGPRSLVELYGQAADGTSEPGRRVAYLERIALLWDEVLGDPARAARAYEQVLELEPDRQTAMVGLQRAAQRIGDDRLLVRALLDEARVSPDRTARLERRVRAASVLARHDVGRAIQLVREVLDEDARHSPARELETRLYEQTGRWDFAAKSVRAQIDLTAEAPQKANLWLSLAQLQHVRLRAPLEALASIERARALDPLHPVPPEEAARVLESHGDTRALRDMLERLAMSAHSPDERARQLARAAEIDELRLGDDAAASRTYQRALAEAPDDEWLAERLGRLMVRRARKRAGNELAELAALLGKRIERAASPEDKRALTFELAALLVESGQEPLRATSLLEALLAEDGQHVPALRTLEWLRRRATVDVASLARVLSREAAVFADVRARLGALWNLAALEEWALPTGDPGGTYRAILELDPLDPSALEASLRRELPNGRRGDARARMAVISALRSLVPFAAKDDARIARELRLALLLESAAADASEAPSDELRREALGWYRDALRTDERSLTAATGVARLAPRYGDNESALAAAQSLAELAEDPRVRSRSLLEGAELLLGPDEDGRLGTRAERVTRAAILLERALAADPDSIPAGGRLATILLEAGEGERLVSAFRDALARSKSPEAVVLFGSEIARVARDELRDLPVAIDAMRRVRAVAPQHVPSLLTLAELCIAQRVWPEAVDALEAVVSTSREIPPKLTALFALASIYEKVLARPAEVDRVLRAVLAVDASNVRALRALLRRLASDSADRTAESRDRSREVAQLLERLANAETDADAKGAILMELAEVQLRLGDRGAAERALVTAVAVVPSNPRAFARLAGLFRGDEGVEAPAFARALTAVIALGEKLGVVEPRWIAALARLELGPLERRSAGIAHLERAVEADPTLYEERFDLAAAHQRAGAPERAAHVLEAMLNPSPHPLLSIAAPTRALALLESALTECRRAEEAVVVAELRALAGDLNEPRAAWLRSRRLPGTDGQASLDRTTLVTHVLPPEGRHVLLEVAAAIAGVEAKVVRSDLTDLGISPRDRIPSRTAHMTRSLLDRVARQLGVADVELVVARKATHVRVLSLDAPWIVVPAGFPDRPEAAQAAALARAVARIAYGVPWLQELSPPQMQALLVAAAHQVAPSYGTAEPRPLASYEAALARALTRRQRKLLDELAPHLTAEGATIPSMNEFIDALLRAELRTAFVVTGDLSKIVDEVALGDPAFRQAVATAGPRALAAGLDHPWVSDVARFALTAGATRLRRRIDSVWDSPRTSAPPAARAGNVVR